MAKETRKLTPVEVCRCGSTELEDVTDRWGEDGKTIYVTLECGNCSDSWEIEFTMTGIKEL